MSIVEICPGCGKTCGCCCARSDLEPIVTITGIGNQEIFNCTGGCEDFNQSYFLTYNEERTVGLEAQCVMVYDVCVLVPGIEGPTFDQCSMSGARVELRINCARDLYSAQGWIFFYNRLIPYIFCSGVPIHYRHFGQEGNEPSGCPTGWYIRDDFDIPVLTCNTINMGFFVEIPDLWI